MIKIQTQETRAQVNSLEIPDLRLVIISNFIG
jgi:hypothetical protein